MRFPLVCTFYFPLTNGAISHALHRQLSREVSRFSVSKVLDRTASRVYSLDFSSPKSHYVYLYSLRSDRGEIGLQMGKEVMWVVVGVRVEALLATPAARKSTSR